MAERFKSRSPLAATLRSRQTASLTKSSKLHAVNGARAFCFRKAEQSDILRIYATDRDSANSAAHQFRFWHCHQRCPLRVLGSLSDLWSKDRSASLAERFSCCYRRAPQCCSSRVNGPELRRCLFT